MTDTLRADVLEVTSPDGSVLGVERVGSGPPLVAVHGGAADRNRWAPIRDALAERYSLYRSARAGREQGGVGRCVLDCARSAGRRRGHRDDRRTGAVSRALVWRSGRDRGAGAGRPDCARDPVRAAVRRGWLRGVSFRERFSALLREDRREDALELFYSDIIRIDPTPLRALPIWQARLAVVHTLEREAETCAAYVPDPAKLAAICTPTRVLLGGDSPPAFGAAARVTVEAIPSADLSRLPGRAMA
jgi:pimeloyl-ACP methyl ester carboxylesterase